jgi:putative ABC transport system permease protein
MTTLWQDIRYGFRMVGTRPGFSFAVVMLVAIGVGGNTAVFSILNAFLLRPLPYKEPGRIVFLQGRDKEGKGKYCVSYPDYLDWQRQALSFEEMACYQFEAVPVRLTDADAPELCFVGMVSNRFFHLLGTRPSVGRFFSEQEDSPSGSPAVVISHAFWRRHFGADPATIGKSIVLQNVNCPIIGVTEAGFQYPPHGQQPADIWMTAGLTQSGEPRGSASQYALGRLRAGVSVAQAQDEMDIICARLAAQYPSTNAGIWAKVQRIQDCLMKGKTQPLLMMAGAVLFVFLVACANVAGLLFARGVTREREMAVRAALGADRWRLVRLMLVENVALALLGGALGVWGAGAVLRLLTRTDMIASMKLPGGFFDLDGRVLAFALLVSVMAVPLFGLLPSIWGSGLRWAGALSTSGRSVLGARGRNVAHAGLLVAQVALTLVLLVGAGLMIRSLANVLTADPGFHPKNVLTMSVDLGGDLTRRQQLLDQLRVLPGVKEAGLAAPLFGGWSWYVYAEGQPVPLPDQAVLATYKAVSTGYFDAMGIRLLRGRTFDEQDRAASKGVAVVDETLARRYWADGDAVGKRIHYGKGPGPEAPSFEIIGVVGHVKNEGAEADDTRMQVYRALLQMPQNSVSIIVRTQGDPAGFVSAVKDAVYQIGGQRLISNTRTLDEILREYTGTRRLVTWLLAAFAGTALFLSSVGIYAVTRYLVSRRIREFGIRMALGARRRDILRLVLRKGLTPVLVGTGVGLAGTLAAARLLSTFLFGLSAWDPVTYVGVALLLISVAFLASYVPARRATRVHPLVALRYE